MSENIRFTLLSHGYIENDLAWNLAVPFPASKSNRETKSRFIQLPSFSVLIEHPEIGYVLYDTGSCPGDEADRRPPETRELFPFYAGREEFLDRRLAELGLSPDDISVIVVSHMHWDHSGGLSFFSGTRAGQNIYVHKKDFMYGLTETHRTSSVVYAGGGYFRDNFEFEGLSYHLIEEDQELAKGLRLITLEGHTPGILGLVAELDSQTYIFPSDAVSMRKNYGPPAVFPGIVYDTLGFRRSIAKLNLLEKKYGAEFIFPHDPEQFASLKKAPYFYE
ncbi:MAG: N-acyl homoserine lactonase family protein [Clostridiales bacterium]|nr:N-acyl homoserine lactonase family protein [Clostridiales bacterium]